MDTRTPVDIAALSLPEELCKWAGDAPVYESSGWSGAKTVFVDRDGGAYLKIAEQGALRLAAQMQAFFAERKLSSPVLFYRSYDRDYMATAALHGEDGIARRHLAQPERLSDIFGESLRRLHEADTSGCPVADRMSGLLLTATTCAFQQNHLDDIATYIGPARADGAALEIARARGLLKNDVLVHGDYCLPNIMLNAWRLQGFIDVADAGIGDRHYDLAWGLWTLNYNLKSPHYGRRFLDAYGADLIDEDRLRICGLLAAMD